MICNNEIERTYVLKRFLFNWLPHKALFTRDILTHNIAIKRYCDKNDIFEP